MSCSSLIVPPKDVCTPYTIELVDEIRVYILTVIMVYTVTCLPQEAQILGISQKVIISGLCDVNSPADFCYWYLDPQ